MKRTIALIISLTMLISLFGCISTSAVQEFVDAEKEIAQQITSDLKDNTVQQSATEKADNNSKTEASTKSNEKEQAKEIIYSIDKEVVVDNEYCTVTIVNGTAKKSGGADFKFTLENKTTDKELMFSMDDTAVNGWIIASFFAESVAAGKKANETLSFSSTDLKDVGLESVDKLEFHLRVYDSNDWAADEFVEETFTVYPTGLTEEEIESPDRRAGKDELVAVDDDNCAFIILDTYVDSIWGYTIEAYIENKTADKNMMFSWDDVSVNGYMIDPFWAVNVTSGNKRISKITFSSTQFEDNDIEKVEEIEFELRVYDYDNWSAKDFVKDVFSYNPAN